MQNSKTYNGVSRLPAEIGKFTMSRDENFNI